MSILTPTQIETADYNQPGWCHIFNANFDRLNQTLLRIVSLVDVDATYLPDHGILTWNSTTSKFRLRVY